MSPMTAHSDHSFELDLVAGRAVHDVEEFAMGCPALTRWGPAEHPLLVREVSVWPQSSWHSV